MVKRDPITGRRGKGNILNKKEISDEEMDEEFLEGYEG